MAVFARLGDSQVDADDIAATLLAKDLARDARAPMAVIRKGADYIVIRNDQRHIGEGELFNIEYPS